ncbi:MAG TPA: class I SAM-dependent methyltransferase [Sedimentisphaerales bacterium]|nr:class I SAM-dependent methyltransferase [Sedimentisphaerales bacterium]
MADQRSDGVLSSFLRRSRVAAAAPYLKGQVLDVGCGPGALAALVDADRYVGMDIDEQSLDIARRKFPYHQFNATLPTDATFDTVVVLAVIEHVSDPVLFLKECGRRLRPGLDSRLICSTPHPRWGWAHNFGAWLGLFSREAMREHKPLLDRRMIEIAAEGAGLRLLMYKRFLLGANQLAVFGRCDSVNVPGASKFGEIPG